MAKKAFERKTLTEAPAGGTKLAKRYPSGRKPHSTRIRATKSSAGDTKTGTSSFTTLPYKSSTPATPKKIPTHRGGTPTPTPLKSKKKTY